MNTKRINISIDDKTKDLLDKFGKQNSLSRSASIRLIVNQYFLEDGK